MPPQCGSAQPCSAVDLCCRRQLCLSSVCNNCGSIYENGNFEMYLPIFTGGLSQGWKEGRNETYVLDSLEKLIHPQTRHWGPFPHLHSCCVRASAVSEKAYCIQISFCMELKDLAVYLRQLHTQLPSTWLQAAAWGGGGLVILNYLLSQWKEMG